MASEARRITITGTMLVADGFERLRLLLLDEIDGAKDTSSWRLRQACEDYVGQKNFNKPYELNHAPDSDGAWGVCLLVAPKRYRNHWLTEAVRLRSQTVLVELTLRRYVLQDAGILGISLDINDIKEIIKK